MMTEERRTAQRPPRAPLDVPFFVVRVRLLLAIGVMVLGGFGVKLASLTLIHGQEFAELAESSMLRSSLIPSPRGLIYDRDGELLASNRLIYDVTFSRVGLTRDEIDATLTELEQWFPERIATWREQMAEGRRLPRRPRALNRRPLEQGQIAPIAERLDTMPGVEVVPTFQRHYPVRGAGLGHILGYVAEVNRTNVFSVLRRQGVAPGDHTAEELAGDREFANFLLGNGYQLGDLVGVQGLEAVYEGALRGVKGREQNLLDAHSQVLAVNVPPDQRATPGHTLRLTLDMDLQREAVRLMGDRIGALIMLDAQTGAVLAMASTPGFDSDQPMTGRGWGALNTDNVGRPLVNRPIREVYNPGSTLKPVVAMGALREGAITPDTGFSCDGTFMLGGHRFRCDYTWGCGVQTVQSAVERSCNIFFYNTMLRSRFGQEGWERVMREASLLAPTGIDLPGEHGGTPPGRQVYPGEAVQLGIGQGPFAATPLQMVTAYARMASNRRNLTPHLVHRIESIDGETVWEWTPPENFDEPMVEDLAPAHRDVVMQGMADVVLTGTGDRVGFPAEWRVSGKTGTAQNRGLIDAWFIAFAPNDAPEIAVGCVVEGGGHGNVGAAPLVRDLMGAYFALQEASGEEEGGESEALGGDASSEST